jgi:hypothetical protein
MATVNTHDKIILFFDVAGIVPGVNVITGLARFVYNIALLVISRLNNSELQYESDVEEISIDMKYSLLQMTPLFGNIFSIFRLMHSQGNSHSAHEGL